MGFHDQKKIMYKVPFRVLRHFTHKASVMRVNAEANVQSADWLMGIFVNELSPSHVRSQQGQCVRQAQFLIVTQRGITASSVGRQFIESIVWYGMIIECYYSIYATDLLYSVKL